MTVCLCVSLTGCMGVIQEFNLYKDGSGTLKTSMGYTEEGLMLMQQMEQGEGVGELDLSSYAKFEYNGVPYYGEVQEVPFDSIDTLNQSSVVKDAGILQFSQNEAGDFLVTATIPEQEQGEQEALPEDPVTEEEQAAEELLKTMAAVYQLSFPYPVTQTAGPSQGVTIDGHHLKLDLMVMGEEVEAGTVFAFVAGQSAKAICFDDVNRDDWFYPAVMSLANGGLVLGVSDHLFDPEGTLTYAQFCQIVARAKHLKTGEAEQYWAYHAIASCIEAGYLLDRGEITEENYDIPIPRQAAVSGMYLARKDRLTNKSDLTAADIPDYQEIADEYKDNVLAAYQFGITKGVDEAGTFLPARSLTRGEICQLFYNLNWVSAQ